MVGLSYRGDREEGVSLLLYRSYKRVTIRPGFPYSFTPKDNTTPEARRYYQKNLAQSKIVVVDDREELLRERYPRRYGDVRKEAPIFEREQPSAAELRIMNSLEDPEGNSDDADLPKASSPEEIIPEDPMTEVAESPVVENSGEIGENPDNPEESAAPAAPVVTPLTETDKADFLDMSPSDLGEYLDMNYVSTAEIKNLISQIGLEIEVGRRQKNSLINDLVTNHFDSVITYFSK